MTVFEHPYVTVAILVAIFLIMIITGLYFTVKSVKTADGTAEKDFCGIGKTEAEFEKIKASGKSCSVIYISISLDGMKRLYSEQRADLMYEEVKRILLKHLCIDKEGCICLCGSENFAALNCLDAKETKEGIDRCFREINEIFIKHGALNVADMHFGYVCTHSNDVSFDTVLERAKKALSIAENKDVLYCQWDNRSGREFERKLKIENNIQNEIDNNSFFLEYQPILDAATNKIIGAEVLSRLNSPTEGILTPRHFISAVNNAGLNRRFDYYIFEKNCRWISNDKENREKYVYTINFSRYTLCDENMAENVLGIIKKYGVDCSCIAIEILEDKNLNDEERAEIVKNLNRLAESGILILLDDFGNGHTGFDDLRDFDVSIVKIDKTVTRNATDPKGFLILKNIVRIAHELGFKALCEGIETEEHKKAAQDAGCDMFQGYYFHEPMSVIQLEKLLKSSSGS